jgi:filamentous hemagglutinin
MSTSSQEALATHQPSPSLAAASPQRVISLSATGSVIFKSAQEIDTSSSKNKSVGVDIGVTLSTSGLSPNASLNLGKGNSSGRDVTNIESVLSAGGTARVVAGFGGRSGENASAGGALTLEGAQLVGNRVEVQAGSLAITSQQDTSVFKSKQTKIGLAVSADFGNSGSKGATNAAGDNGTGRSFGGAGASVSFGQTKQSGDFASVQEQSGITVAKFSRFRNLP